MNAAEVSILGALEAAGESALLAWGDKSQMIKACEEMGELITVLSKRLNGSPVLDAQVIDEIADVLIMANQMRILFGKDKVDERILQKLNRTLAVIRELKKSKQREQNEAKEIGKKEE